MANTDGKYALGFNMKSRISQAVKRVADFLSIVLYNSFFEPALCHLL